MIYNKAEEYGVKYKSLLKIENFRDLGGYDLTNGRVTASGKLFRSGALNGLMDKERADFDALHITHIFDFRNQNEIDEAEDYVPSFATYHKIPVITSQKHTAVSRADMIEIMKRQMTDKEFQFGEEMFLEMYGLFPFNEAYRALFKAMDTGENILFHCSAGKDRTGVAAALILSALGADKDTIKYDYLVTNIFRQEANKALREKFSPYLKDERVSHLFEIGMSVNEKYLNRAVEAIMKKYSSIDEFLEKEYDITKKRKEAWIQSYTVEK